MSSRTLHPPALPGSARNTLDGAQGSDAVLLERARAGDAVAFAAVYERHAAAAYGLARRMLHGPGAAQDVVQEAFLSLWRTDGYCAQKGSLRNFLLGIVRNRALDAMRKDRRHSTQSAATTRSSCACQPPTAPTSRSNSARHDNSCAAR